MADKSLCRCGKTVENIKSYFNKSGGRITVCERCAQKLGLADTEKWDSILHSELKTNTKPKANG